jgi:hypothetical protein
MMVESSPRMMMSSMLRGAISAAGAGLTRKAGMLRARAEVAQSSSKIVVDRITRDVLIPHAGDWTWLVDR